MKRLILVTALFFTAQAQAQTITLFEAGGGAPQSMYEGFGGISWLSDESGSFTQLSGPSNDSIKVFFNNPIPSGADFWITKRIPQMEIYAQLELFADMTLPQTADFSYSVSVDSVSWTTVPFANPNTPIAFDNSAGNQFLRVNVRLNESDSVRFSYNYVSVKADTNFVIGIEENESHACAVSTFGQTITVQTDYAEAYTLNVFDLTGRAVFTAAGNGSQTFTTTGLNGIYHVNVRSGDRLLTKRCYLGE